MSSLSDEGVKGGNAFFSKGLRGGGKQNVRIVVASLIRNDRQHTFTRADCVQSFLNYCGQFRLSKLEIRRAFPDQCKSFGCDFGRISDCGLRISDFRSDFEFNPATVEQHESG